MGQVPPEPEELLDDELDEDPLELEEEPLDDPEELLLAPDEELLEPEEELLAPEDELPEPEEDELDPPPQLSQRPSLRHTCHWPEFVSGLSPWVHQAAE